MTTKSIQVKITEINKKLLNLGKLVKDLTDNLQNKTGIDSSTVLMSDNSRNTTRSKTLKISFDEQNLTTVYLETFQ